MEYYTQAFKQFADFHGRTGLRGFWMFILINFVISIVLSFASAIILMPFLSILYSLVVLIPAIAITARRLHDIGKSGWWQLILLIPLIGLIVMIIFCIKKSEDDNQYGPKSVG